MATINDLYANEELLAGLVEAESPAELAEVFAKNNIELEEGLTIEEAFKLVKEQENAKADELNEEDLEDVAGGIALTVALGAAGAFIAGGAVIIGISGYAYTKYKMSKKKKK